jgi:hypothetical protein
VNGTPAVGVEVDDDREKPLTGPGEIVSGVEAEVKPVAAPVMVGVPDVVSPYQKVAEDCPAGIVTDVTAAEPAELEKVPFREEDVSVTVSGMIVKLLFAASSVTVIGP